MGAYVSQPPDEGHVSAPWPTAEWAGASRSDVPLWIQAGLEVIDKVKTHEKETRISVRQKLADAEALIASLQEQVRLAGVPAEGVPAAQPAMESTVE
jgi:hypothetical protein